MFNMKKKEDFEKFRDLFESLGCTYELRENSIIISDRWSMRIIIPLTQRLFCYTVESIDEGKDMGVDSSLWFALSEVAREYNGISNQATYYTPNQIKIPTTIISEDVTVTDNSKNTFIKHIDVFDNRKK